MRMQHFAHFFSLIKNAYRKTILNVDGIMPKGRISELSIK